MLFSWLVVLTPLMYSLSTQEKLNADRDQNSSREILWRNLRDKKKSGRMVHRIYNKTRCATNDIVSAGQCLLDTVSYAQKAPPRSYVTSPSNAGL